MFTRQLGKRRIPLHSRFCSDNGYSTLLAVFIVRQQKVVVILRLCYLCFLSLLFSVLWKYHWNSWHLMEGYDIGSKWIGFHSSYRISLILCPLWMAILNKSFRGKWFPFYNSNTQKRCLITKPILHNIIYICDDKSISIYHDLQTRLSF